MKPLWKSLFFKPFIFLLLFSSLLSVQVASAAPLSVVFRAVNQHNDEVMNASIEVNGYGTIAGGASLQIEEGTALSYRGAVSSIYGNYHQKTVVAGESEITVPFREVAFNNRDQTGAEVPQTGVILNDSIDLAHGSLVDLPQGAVVSVQGENYYLRGPAISHTIDGTTGEIVYPFQAVTFHLVDNSGNSLDPSRVKIIGYGFIEQSYGFIDNHQVAHFPQNTTISYRPVYGETSYIYHSYVSDQTSDITVTLDLGNTPPTANAGPDQTVYEGAMVTLDGSGSVDQEGDPISYLWNQAAGPLANLSGASTVSPSFAAPFVGAGGEDLDFRLQVNDDQQFNDTLDEVKVVVLDDSTLPDLSLSAPSDGSTVQNLRPVISGLFADLQSGIDPGSFKITLNGQDVTSGGQVTGGAFSFTPTANLLTGVQTVTVEVADRAGNRRGPLTSQFTITAPLTITITSPHHRDTVDNYSAVISGSITYANGVDAGVVINGIVAQLSGNNFTAAIPLSTGTNTVTATVTDSLGNSQSTSIDILTNSPNEPVVLVKPEPESGLGPLTVSFDLINRRIKEIVAFAIDYDGDGTIDDSSPTEKTFSHTYSTEQLHHPRMVFTDKDGNSYSWTGSINVIALAIVDPVIQQQWTDLKKDLVQTDVNQALSRFHPRSQAVYQEQYNTMAPILDSIGKDMGQIRPVEITDKSAEYEILVDLNGKTYSFQLILVKDDKGLWKIYRF